ncbi:hypothetical protein HMN09_00032500 [Mycena chlorophos]|uniref:Uncharacterized protein n=1 Tax=Mycena chlorophos TaxID=658473 RepID=A0A8H6TVK4_MYCCL|nr:hypothetical protein HMN09_00032500 [Mycena chlorophos]
MSSFLSSAKSESERPSTLARTDTPLRRPPSRRSARSQRPIPTPFKATLYCAGFLPIPPVVSALYAAVGHGVLHHTVTTVPIHTAVAAAAVGGTILALPLALLLYLLLFPTTPPSPEDFFDDEDVHREPWTTYATYALLGALVLTLGAIATPLGAVCLSAQPRLGAAQAAEMGIVGGVVIDAALLLAGAVGAFALVRKRKRNDSDDILS